MNTVPVFGSTVMYQIQTLVPDRPRHPSSSQVSWPTSPSWGTVWNSHSFRPVRASKARLSPDGPTGISATLAPTISTFL